MKADPEEEEANAASLLAQPPLPQSPPRDGHNEGEDQEEEEKPDVKPKLHVTYNGFSIFGRTLVVVYVQFE